MLAALLTTATLACGGAASPPEAPAAPTPSAPPASPEPPSATATAPPAPDKPRTAPLTRTPDDALGATRQGVGLAVGERAPDAALIDIEDRPFTLASAYARGPLLVVFYRGGWCPYCNTQIHELAEAWPELSARKVGLVAISVDRVEEASKTASRWDIPFPVLSDSDLVAHRAFRVVHQADEAEVARLEGFGISLESASGRSHHAFAVPALFLVVDGVVRWSHADPDYKVRPSTQQLVETLDRLAPR